MSIRVGVIGGCLSHQPGMRKSDLYTSIIRQRFWAERRISIIFSIARDFQHSFIDRLDRLISQGPIDIVLLHVRSSFAEKASFFDVQSTESNVLYYINPNLFSRQSKSYNKCDRRPERKRFLIFRRRRASVSKRSASVSSLSTSSELGIFDTPPNPRRILGFSLRNLMYLAGIISGISHRAIEDEVQNLMSAIERCSELKLPIVIMGPSRRFDCFGMDFICHMMDRRLMKILDRIEVPYIGLHQKSRCGSRLLFLPDGHHLNADGHEEVAKCIFREVNKLV